jgi:S1-C subfamily serine protease
VGIAFAVPINTAKEFLPRLERGGQVTLAYLGVSGASSRSAPGVSVTVVPGGPAASAGVRDRDVIRAIDGRGVRAMSEVEAIVAARLPGAAVQVQIRRGAATRTVKVVLGSRPGHAPK